MENNEISMFMEVKCDLGEKKTEVLQLRNWIKCLVKIEAIKCFPCYVRITFIRNVEDENANLCVRINIPGLSSRLAVSRTKTHSYGLFWKQNRKRCCIFLAFDSESTLVRHMKWMKKSIKNLELHRQELLQAKRNSIDHSGQKDVDVAITSTTMEETKGIRDLQDILGPLPKIPDVRESGNWSRRVSGVSGIYEEIPNGDWCQRRTSRGSIASGIYEEMKPPKTNSPKIDTVSSATKPPLPQIVRKRINTNEIDCLPIRRSNTSPEAELSKKKKYLAVLESVFGRSKRSASVSEGKVSQMADFEEIAEGALDTTSSPSVAPAVYAGLNVIVRQKLQQKKFTKFDSKRNSFSTPDLTNPCLFSNFESLDDVSLESFDSNVFMADDQAMSNECIPFHAACNPTPDSFMFDLNVSDQIQPNFNISCNMSTVNLVGANLNSTKPPVNVIVDDLSGYCVMAPIKKDRKKSSDSNKENEIDTKVNCDDQIYEKMYLNQNTPSPENVTSQDTHIYQNLLPAASPNPTNSSISRQQTVINENDDLKKSHRKSTCIDDKVPSYYPNNCDLIKTHRRKSNSVSDKSCTRHLNSIKVSHCENFYISSPQKILDHRKGLNVGDTGVGHLQSCSVKLRAMKTSPTLYSVVKSGDDAKPNGFTNSPSHTPSPSGDGYLKTPHEQEMNTKNNERSPRMYQKYATLARLSPNKYLDKCAKKSNDLSNIKKFASLPRFKKIDFSPLKMKINSVLQRHNPEGI